VVESNEEKVLTALGLTSSQARVYLALARNGSSKVTAISQATGIHRTHLYEVLKSLEEQGFVEKQLAAALYTPIPLKDAAQSLVKYRQQEISKLENAINHIAESLPQKHGHHHHSKHEITLTSSKNSSLNKGLKYLRMATVQIDQMHTWRRFTQLWDFFGNAYISALDRGIRIRQIVEFPTDRRQAQKIFSAPEFSNSRLELKFVSKTGGNIMIMDNKKILISTSQTKENLGETPLLFSDYEGLLGLMQTYFAYSWQHGYKWNSELLCEHSKHSDACFLQKKGS
jgi:sugar-specific transcriptional regulator TrmB